MAKYSFNCVTLHCFLLKQGKIRKLKVRSDQASASSLTMDHIKFQLSHSHQASVAVVAAVAAAVASLVMTLGIALGSI